ncbi:MAG: hypothetical protein U0586_13245 [Candidatus Brocadiaceae bacterium]
MPIQWGLLVKDLQVIHTFLNGPVLTEVGKRCVFATPSTLFFQSSLREMADIFLVHGATSPSVSK